MVLTLEEEALLKVVRALPPEEANKVLTWASQLAALAQGRLTDWSDSWSDEDLRDAAAASLHEFETQESGER
ncbi:MAG: hypothetical protein SGI92_01405 [Bryobacteraceae bacterium]|nr:hypothetical protein [Bryobacteraceae bacterium]